VTGAAATYQAIANPSWENIKKRHPGRLGQFTKTCDVLPYRSDPGGKAAVALPRRRRGSSIVRLVTDERLGHVSPAGHKDLTRTN